MDNELIKMCSCSEIQEDWQPKVGDAVYEVSEKQVKYIVDTSSITTYDSEDVCIHLNCDDGYHNLSFSDTAHIIYIPRIEDLLELLSDEQICLDNPEMWDGTHWSVTCAGWVDEGGKLNPSQNHEADNPVKALLMAYMYISHSKTWTEEAWA